MATPTPLRPTTFVPISGITAKGMPVPIPFNEPCASPSDPYTSKDIMGHWCLDDREIFDCISFTLGFHAPIEYYKSEVSRKRRAAKKLLVHSRPPPDARLTRDPKLLPFYDTFGAANLPAESFGGSPLPDEIAAHTIAELLKPQVESWARQPRTPREAQRMARLAMPVTACELESLTYHDFASDAGQIDAQESWLKDEMPALDLAPPIGFEPDTQTSWIDPSVPDDLFAVSEPELDSTKPVPDLIPKPPATVPIRSPKSAQPAARPSARLHPYYVPRHCASTYQSFLSTDSGSGPGAYRSAHYRAAGIHVPLRRPSPLSRPLVY